MRRGWNLPLHQEPLFQRKSTSQPGRTSSASSSRFLEAAYLNLIVDRNQLLRCKDTLFAKSDESRECLETTCESIDTSANRHPSFIYLTVLPLNDEPSRTPMKRSMVHPTRPFRQRVLLACCPSGHQESKCWNGAAQNLVPPTCSDDI